MHLNNAFIENDRFSVNNFLLKNFEYLKKNYTIICSFSYQSLRK